MRNAGLIRVIVAGGDGTVMWVVEECMKHHLDTSRIAIGVIPFGTGNDFSRVLGWGGAEPKTLLGKDFKGLKKMLYKWVTALIEDYDIWEVTMDVKEVLLLMKNGSIRKIKKQAGVSIKEELKDASGKSIHSFKKNMCNYFSIGIESRIGLGFERNRAKSRAANKMVYAWEGFKKLFLKTHRLNNVISHVEEINEDGEGKKVVNTVGNGPPETTLKGNPTSLVAINIGSFMGGACNPWQDCKSKSSGLLTRKSIAGEVSFGDSKVEFVSYNSSIAMGMERVVKGRGHRVHQGKPPLKIFFKGPPQGANSLITYFQVDGEFFQMENPISATIVPHPNLPNGKIKVLMENSSRR